MNPTFVKEKSGFFYATVVFNLAEDENIESIEEGTYDLAEFVADIGGAAGLVLGMNFLSVITCLTKVSKYLYMKAMRTELPNKFKQLTSQVLNRKSQIYTRE